MKKRILTILLAASMVFGLAACGGSKKPDASTNNTEEIPEKPDYTITISAAVSLTGDGFATIKQAAEDFNASQSDYKIDMYYAGSYSDILTVVQTSSPSDIPDLYMLSGNTASFVLANKQYYVPTQKFMDEDNYDDSDIVEFFATNYKKDGAWQMIPWGNTNTGQYWNEDILARVGLKVEDMDSYEDILAGCDKLAAAGYKNFYGMAQMKHNDWLNYAMAAEDIDYCDNDNARGGCPTKYLYMEDKTCHDAALAYFNFLREMINRGYVADNKLTASDLFNGFAKGDLVVVDSYASRTATILNSVNGAFKVGYSVSPTIYASTQSKGQAPGGNCWIIGNSGNYWSERGAWEFVKYLLGEHEVGAQFAIDSGYTPVTYNSTKTEIYQNYIKDVFPDTQKIIDAQWATPVGIGYAPSPVQSEVQAHFTNVVYDMWDNHSYTAEQALKDFTDKSNESLGLYRITNQLD